MCDYQFRGLPCNILSDGEIWWVAGSFGDGGGILEWCYDEDDAKYLLSEMIQDKRFSNLYIGYGLS